MLWGWGILALLFCGFIWAAIYRWRNPNRKIEFPADEPGGAGAFLLQHTSRLPPGRGAVFLLKIHQSVVSHRQPPWIEILVTKGKPEASGVQAINLGYQERLINTVSALPAEWQLEADESTPAVITVPNASTPYAMLRWSVAQLQRVDPTVEMFVIEYRGDGF